MCVRHMSRLSVWIWACTLPPLRFVLCSRVVLLSFDCFTGFCFPTLNPIP